MTKTRTKLRTNEPAAPILWEDGAVRAYDKPSGLPVLGERWEPEARCLVDILHEDWAEGTCVHRIDKETSGIVLCARDPATARFFEEAFRTGQVAKTYLALVPGRIPPDGLRCEEALRVDGDRRHRTVVDPRHGAASCTVFLPEEGLGAHTLVRALPLTGRTHQIRVHAAHHGHPLVGDSLYGGAPLLLSRVKRGYRAGEGEERPLLDRVALHAWRVSFPHPRGGTVEIEAPLPRDLEKALAQLRRNR